MSALLRSSLLALVFLAPPTWAEGDTRVSDQGVAEAARALASEHYARGVERAERRDFSGALEAFETAYRISPHYAVLYNIGQAHIELGEPVQAITALEAYLDEGAGQISQEREQETRDQVAVQRTRTASLSVVVDAPGATLELDGVELGTTGLNRPLLVSAGRHTVSVRAPGRAPATREIHLGSEETSSIVLSLLPLADQTAALRVAPASTPRPPPPAAAPTPPDPDTLVTSPSAKYWGYALAGAGLVTGGVAIGYYFYNRRRYGQWQAEDHDLETNPPLDDYRQRQLANNELADSIEAGSRVTFALGVASGALLVGGTTLLVVGSKTHSDGAAREGTQVAVVVGTPW